MLTIRIVHVYEATAPAELHHKLDLILAALSVTKEREITMSKQLDDLTAQVKANTDVEASALLAINGLAARLADAGTDPAKLQALQDDLAASATRLAAAVAANTPGAPPGAP